MAFRKTRARIAGYLARQAAKPRASQTTRRHITAAARAIAPKPAVPAEIHPEKLSKIFLDWGWFGKAIGAATGRTQTGEALGYLKEMGNAGALVHAALRFGPGRLEARRKRKEVTGILSRLAQKNPHALANPNVLLATARYLHGNNSLRRSALHDKLAERSVFAVFGEAAKKDHSFGRTMGSLSPEAAGKKFFRNLVRNKLLLFNIDFLKKNYSEETMDSIRFALIGRKANSHEIGDLRRIKFITDIFREGGEISALDNAANHGPAGIRDRVFALTSLQFKAAKLDPEEKKIFFFFVCDHYGINPGQIHAEAKNLFHNPGLKAEMRKPDSLYTVSMERYLKFRREARAVYSDFLRA